MTSGYSCSLGGRIARPARFRWLRIRPARRRAPLRRGHAAHIRALRGLEIGLARQRSESLVRGWAASPTVRAHFRGLFSRRRILAPRCLRGRRDRCGPGSGRRVVACVDRADAARRCRASRSESRRGRLAQLASRDANLALDMPGCSLPRSARESRICSRRCCGLRRITRSELGRLCLRCSDCSLRIRGESDMSCRSDGPCAVGR